MYKSNLKKALLIALSASSMRCGPFDVVRALTQSIKVKQQVIQAVDPYQEYRDKHSKDYAEALEAFAGPYG